MSISNSGSERLTVWYQEGIHKRLGFDGVLGLDVLALLAKIVISYPEQEISFVPTKEN